jgi:hypothetical protein
MSNGEEDAWLRLLNLNPENVCHNAKADFNEVSGHYVLPVFNTQIFVSPTDRLIRGDTWIARLLLNGLAYYSRLPSLWYLIDAKDTSLSGELINPRQVGGGLIFDRGSHVLPLDKILERYSYDVNEFIRRGTTLGGEQLDHGDASIRLFPFPKVPVVLIVWNEDSEFPARADILFDSTCTQHLSTDMIWATAMMSILILLT